MRFSKLILTVGLLFVLAVAITACGQKDDKKQQGQQEQKVVLKFGGIQSAEDAASQAMEMMAKSVKEKTNGTLEIQSFPASQLGNATSQVEAVSLGSQDMFVDASSWVGQFVPDKQVEALFFTFRDEDHFRKYLASDINRQMEEQFRQKKGIRIVSNNWLRLPRVIASKKPVKSMEDLQGVKMRVPDIKGYLESVSAMGAKPTQVAWGEVYLALTQGVVDACEGPQDSMYTMKFYEPTKKITNTYHIRDNLVVMINDKKFDSLSPKQKEALTAAAKETGDWYAKTVKERLKDFDEKMKAAGTEFYEADVSPMRAKMAEAAARLEKSGAWRQGLYQDIQKL